MKKLIRNKKGFTLIELIVVIAILAILAAILIPSITGYIEKANDATASANARSAYTVAALDYATDGTPALDPTYAASYGGRTCTFTVATSATACVDQ